MEELKNKMLSAYRWLDQVSVIGASVDYMAMARQELRAAIKLLDKESSDG